MGDDRDHEGSEPKRERPANDVTSESEGDRRVVPLAAPDGIKLESLLARRVDPSKLASIGNESISEGDWFTGADDDEVVWFEAEELARRSAVDLGTRSAFFCRPLLDIDTPNEAQFWGELQPSYVEGERSEVAAALQSLNGLLDGHRQLALESEDTALALDLLEQCLESLWFEDLFDASSPGHRVVLVGDRGPSAWRQSMWRRWEKTSGPGDRSLRAAADDIASRFGVIHPTALVRDEDQVLRWLVDGDASAPGGRGVLGLDLGACLRGADLDAAHRVLVRVRQWANRGEGVCLVAGCRSDFDRLGWDPRDRLELRLGNREGRDLMPGERVVELRWRAMGENLCGVLCWQPDAGRFVTCGIQ